ncbi:hypothetical protein QZH41_014481 [Actinostola sp. cb2023]|nr:hypothetical protein QZH41_014481 [Actinostola sp. cb2023]
MAPPPPPAAPPPPPIMSDIPPPPAPPTPSEAPVSTEQQPTHTPTVPQSNTTGSNGEKVWERPWSIAELRKGTAKWNLAADSGLLLYLQQFSQKMVSQTHEIEKQVDGLVNNTKGIHSKVQNTVNDFLMLSNIQFIENRVYEEDDITKDGKEEKDGIKDDQTQAKKSREQQEQDVLPRISEALKHGLSVLNDAFITIELKTEHDSDEEEDENVQTNYNPQPILEPKDLYGHRPLPHLIGTADFYKDDLIGLGESESEEEAVDEEEEAEGKSSESESELTSSVSGSEESEVQCTITTESETESDSDASMDKMKNTKIKPKKKEIEYSSSEEDEDLFGGEKKTKKMADSDEEEEEDEDEEEKPNKPAVAGPMGFAAELAAKIGVSPPPQHKDSDDEEHEGFSDEEVEKKPKVVEKTRSESRASTGSRTKGKKDKHHHHHKKGRAGTKDSHGHRNRHDSKTSKVSTTEEDLFGQPNEGDDGLFDREGSPFTKKGGLFSGGGGLFDDESQDGGMFGDDEEETPSKKEVSREEGFVPGSLTSESSIPDAKSKPAKQDGGLFDEDEGLFADKKPTEIPKPVSRMPSKTVDLFGGDDEDEEEKNGLFSGASQPITAPPKKKSGRLGSFQMGCSRRFAQRTRLMRGGCEHLDVLVQDETFEKDMLSDIPTENYLTQIPRIPAGAVSIFGEQSLLGKPIHNQQVSKPKAGGGGGLFSDEDEEESGGLFATTSVLKAQAAKGEANVRPKSKTTISLFDDDEQDEDDFFSSPAPTKPTSDAAKKETNAPEEQRNSHSTLVGVILTLQKSKHTTSKSSGLFIDDEGDLFDSPAPTRKATSNAKPILTEKAKPKSSSKMPSMFSDGEDDGGLFGGNADDIFEATSPPKNKDPAISTKKAVQTNQKPSVFSDGEDDLFASTPTENAKAEEPKPTSVTKPKPAASKPSLFSDEEEDLFSTVPVVKQDVEQKKEKEEDKESKKSRKPVGGVSLFGGVDLFAGKKPSFTEADVKEPKQEIKEEKSSVFKAKASAPLSIDDDDSDDNDGFFGKPKPPPLSTTPTPSLVRPPSQAKTGPSLFSDDDDEPALPTGPPPSKAKAAPILFSNDDEDLFSAASKATSATIEQQNSEDSSAAEKLVNEKAKKPAGAVSMFGGVDLFGSSPSKSVEKNTEEAPKTKDPLGMFDDTEDDLFTTKPKASKVLKATTPVPLPKTTQPEHSLGAAVSSAKSGSGIEKLQKSLAFNPAMLRPGGPPPKKEATSVQASFDEPLTINTLETVGKERAKLQVKRRPPTRQARRAAATASASDETLFGSALGGESAPVLPRSKSTSLDDTYVTKIQVNSLPDFPDIDEVQRRGTKDSDMSDEFFGFASSQSIKDDTPSKPSVSTGFLTDDLFGSLSKPSKLSSDNKIIQDTSSKKLDEKPVSKTIHDDVDLFSSDAHKRTVDKKTDKPKTTKSSMFDDDDLFSFGTTEKLKVESHLDNDDLFSSQSKKTETKKTVGKEVGTKNTSLFATGGHDSKASQDDYSSKQPDDKKTRGSAKPVEDDLFGAKKTESEEKTAEIKTKATKDATSKSKVLLEGDDDDDLFKVPSRPKKVVKSLGDDDLFGDSGNIFDDVPSKPKEKKKKKKAVADATGDSIFDDAPGEKTTKKTKTKKKTSEKKPAKTTSIFDDDAPSIFDDPLNATANK